MGFKDKCFQESVEKNSLEKSDEDIAESDSSLTKLEQLLDKYKADVSKDRSSPTEDYEASSEFKPTESEGSVGENSLPGSLAVKDEHKPKDSAVVNDDAEGNINYSPDISTQNLSLIHI